MKICLTKFYYFEVPFKAQISRYKTTVSPQLVVLLKYENDYGFGSAPVHHAKGYDIYRFYQKKIKHFFEDLNLDSFKEYRERISINLLYPESAVAYAIDQALWDLEGKIENKNVVQLLAADYKDKIDITEQLFIDDFGSNKALLRKMMDRGTRRIKIKTGINIKEDIQYLKKLRDFCGKNIEFQIDPNSAYTLSDAIKYAGEFSDIGVVMWEDPLNTADFLRYAELRKKTSIPVMLDRAITTEKDLNDAINMNALDILNVKLSRIGGLTNALKLAKICNQNKIRVSIGCAEDLGPSTATILIFSGMSKKLYATEGVGSYRLKFDIIDHEFHIKDGHLRIPMGEGLGVSFNEDKLNKMAHEKNFRIFDFSNGSGKYSLMLKKYKNKLKKAPAHYYTKIFKS